MLGDKNPGLYEATDFTQCHMQIILRCERKNLYLYTLSSISKQMQ